jgi:hypothetical protein
MRVVVREGQFTATSTGVVTQSGTYTVTAVGEQTGHEESESFSA